MIWPFIIIVTNIITYYMASNYGSMRITRQVLRAGLMPALQAHLSRALIELDIKMKIASWYEEEHELHLAVSKRFVNGTQKMKEVTDE